MIRNASFRRKIVYGILIVILLIPVSLISQPSSRNSEGQMSTGGTLAQMRTKHGLSQAELGEIDPTSETMKLATLGMRGIAANLLWDRANKYKREQDWDNLSATLNQIVKLQPNFLSVWQFQGWNLAYNVSIEFDDYRSRYHWVKKGIDFLSEGISYNLQEPVLYWELGWTFGHKIGKADEYVQFRRLFRDDGDFHDRLSQDINMDETIGPDNKPDSWLSGREWFLLGEALVDSGIPISGSLIDDTGRIKRGKNPVIFHSHPPKWKMNYANAIEEEGYLGEKAQIAWRDAGIDWEQDYGNRELVSSDGNVIRLSGMQALLEEQVKLSTELDDLVGGIREEIVEEKKASLSAEEREALEIDFENRSQDHHQLVESANKKLEVTHEEVADRSPIESRHQAKRLAKALFRNDELIQATQRYRNQVAFEYWRARCDIEQTDTAVNARKLVYEADELYDSGNFLGMKTKYEEAWKLWASIYKQYPSLLESPDSEDLYDAIQRYRWVITQMEEDWPPRGFPLGDVVRYYDETYAPHPDDLIDATNNDDADEGESREDTVDSNSESEASANSTDGDADSSPTDQPVSDESAAGENESDAENPSVEPSSNTDSGAESSEEATPTENASADESSESNDQEEQNPPKSEESPEPPVADDEGDEKDEEDSFEASIPDE